MNYRIRFRRDTVANWTATNPILGQGELGLELETKNIKIGDGTTPWNSLVYGGIVGPQGPQGVAGPQGLQGIQGNIGLDGIQGIQGIQGQQGTQGPTGANATWICAAGAPSAGTGNNGDMYLNKTTGDVYGPKAAGAWGSVQENIATSGLAASAIDSNGTGTIPYTDENGLRIIRGYISSTGTILSGAGFTVSKSSTGFFIIDFTIPFSDIPSVTASPYHNGAAQAHPYSLTAAQLRITILDYNHQLIDYSFCFIAFGAK
jgi:hypothetical protein